MSRTNLLTKNYNQRECGPRHVTDFEILRPYPANGCSYWLIILQVDVVLRYYLADDKLPPKGVATLRRAFLEFWDPLPISGTGEARNFESWCVNRLVYVSYWPANEKLPSNRALPGSRDRFLNFGTPLPICGTVEGRNLKFGTWLHYMRYKLADD